MPSIKNYLSLIKFSHTIFAMPFALIGFFVGLASVYNRGLVSLLLTLNLPVSSKYDEGGSFVMANTDKVFKNLLLIILCMIFARSAAMAFNRWLDANYDAKNPRSRQGPIRRKPSFRQEKWPTFVTRSIGWPGRNGCWPMVWRPPSSVRQIWNSWPCRLKPSRSMPGNATPVPVRRDSTELAHGR